MGATGGALGEGSGNRDSVSVSLCVCQGMCTSAHVCVRVNRTDVCAHFVCVCVYAQVCVCV